MLSAVYFNEGQHQQIPQKYSFIPIIPYCHQIVKKKTDRIIDIFSVLLYNSKCNIHEWRKGTNVALQLIVDLYGCDAALLNDMELVKNAAREAVHSIGAEIVEECMHQFTPIGISYIAVISASHFSIHTWPEYGYAAVDVFSCSDDVPETVADALQKAFHSERQVIRAVERSLKGE
ncbi:MAG: adenosylmethionine decarboxylase [Oscillospiraceae bacterium]|nr:adenosylmethionine decarboxylase [Oscillospiraceae bacterium]